MRQSLPVEAIELQSIRDEIKGSLLPIVQCRNRVIERRIEAQRTVEFTARELAVLAATLECLHEAAQFYGAVDKCR